MKNILDIFSKHILLSLVVFVLGCFIFIKLYEKFLSIILSDKFKFLKDRNKEVCFEIALFGAIFLTFSLFIEAKYGAPFIWLFCSISLLFGGGLGLIPFSFIEKTKKK